MFASSRSLPCHSLARYCLLLPLYLLLTSLAWAEEAGDDQSVQPTFEQEVYGLVQGNLSQRADSVTALITFDDERVITILSALQEGNLHADRDTPPLVAIRDGNTIINALTGDVIEAEMAAELRRVPINNRMRSQLRTQLSRMNLNHDDATVRYNEAVEKRFSEIAVSCLFSIYCLTDI